jgi:hypothetical protein
MREEFHLPGRVVTIDDPLGDGLRLVRAAYPDATREGSAGHWSYFLRGRIVGEAWVWGRRWRLRIADEPQPDPAFVP